MAVHEDGVLVVVAGRFHEDERRAAGQAMDRDLEAFDRLRLAPIDDQLDGAFHVPGAFPLGIERGRLVGNADVVEQLRDDAAFEGAIDELTDGVVVHGEGGDGTVEVRAGQG